MFCVSDGDPSLLITIAAISGPRLWDFSPIVGTRSKRIPVNVTLVLTGFKMKLSCWATIDQMINLLITTTLVEVMVLFLRSN